MIIHTIPLLLLAFTIQNLDIPILVLNFNNVSIVNNSVGAKKFVKIHATSAPLGLDTIDDINVYNDAIPSKLI